MNAGWFYSNTNNILAALIIEKASGLSLKGAFEKEFKRIGLHDTFYSAGRYPDAVLARVSAGLYKNAACLAYQPAPCERSTIAPLIGKDMRLQNLSWAGGTGAIVFQPAGPCQVGACLVWRASHSATAAGRDEEARLAEYRRCG